MKRVNLIAVILGIIWFILAALFFLYLPLPLNEINDAFQNFLAQFENWDLFICITAFYVILLLENYWGFRKIEKLGKNPHEYELNFVNRIMMKRLGIKPALIINLLGFEVLLYFVLLLESIVVYFIGGMLLGMILAVIFHDWLTIHEVLDQLETRQKSAGAPKSL